MFGMDTFEIRLMCVPMHCRLLFIATGASTDVDTSSGCSSMAASLAEGVSDAEDCHFLLLEPKIYFFSHPRK